MKVLLVNGQASPDKSLEKVITKRGYEVLSAGDYLGAWSICSKVDAPRLVVVSHAGKPWGQRLEICKQLKQDVELPFTHVIMVAGGTELEEAASTEGGPDDLLSPEETADELCDRLRTATRLLDYMSLWKEPAEKPLELPLPEEQARRLIEERLIWQLRMTLIDEERRSLAKASGMPSEVVDELHRQSKELQQLPTAEKARASIERFEGRMARLQQAQAQQAQEQAAEGSGQAPEEQEPEPLPPEFERARQLAYQQWAAFTRLEQATPSILKETLRAVAPEPLYVLCQKHGIDADELFGWAIYVIVLEQFRIRHLGFQESAQEAAKSLEVNGTGIKSLFKGSEHRQEESDQRARGEGHAALIAAIEREKQFLEKRMANAFWQVYAEAAVLLVTGQDLAPDDLPILRAFLRYGMIGQASFFLDPEVVEYILDDCRTDVRTVWEDSSQVTHALYADEYIGFVARGFMTPAIDEKLELNRNRYPEEARIDTLIRRQVYSRTRQAILREMGQSILPAEAADWRQKAEEANRALAGLSRSEGNYAERKAEYEEAFRRCSGEASRCEQTLDKIEKQFLPEMIEQAAEAQQKLSALADRPTVADMARKEAGEVRRISRLCAHFQEPFPPLTLRAEFKVGTDRISSRKSMMAELADIEQRDPTVFKDVLIPANNADRRVYIRFSPYFLITPTLGSMGFSWNPRFAVEVGRLAFPGYCTRGDQRRRMLYYILADFRWDTHKSRSGMDLMNSDTICAAYANVRWFYRRKDKDECEKAAIFKDENHRQNWRRHYNLHMMSADDAGRKLFLRCPMVYEQVVLKYISLPADVQPLKRSSG